MKANSTPKPPWWARRSLGRTFAEGAACVASSDDSDVHVFPFGLWFNDANSRETEQRRKVTLKFLQINRRYSVPITYKSSSARFSLAKGVRKVFIDGMDAVISDSRVPDIQAQARDLTKRQMEQWFVWMDGMLAIHRGNFVFREPTPAQLEEHKTGLKLAIRCCLFINTLIADPDFNDPDLVSRLQVRVRQLQDAYDTFHDTALSDAQAEEFLKQVFPK
ncbi:MAG: hypothetical protein ABSA83_17910 [Verrucomicrobiota bacterium]